jgi:hypothetical protein
MAALIDHQGSWVGANDFRLMPTDPFHAAPATAEVTADGAVNLISIAYSWSHQIDGKQTGLLVIGSGDQQGSAVALWADSWHQSPAAKVLTGTSDNGQTVVGYKYGGDWEWRITLDTRKPDMLRIVMDNVVPESAAAGDIAGPYAAMVAVLHRA